MHKYSERERYADLEGRVNQTLEVSHVLCLFCFINAEHEVLLAFEFCHERSF